MTSLVPSDSTRTQLEEACQRYAEALAGSPAERYLTEERAITREALASFRLGYVAEPLVGFEQYRGKIAIPYITASGVTSIRYRSVGASSGAKYLTVDGDSGKRIYNPMALSGGESFICVCEGELDAITAWQCGLPAIGIPGAGNWEPYNARALRWYSKVYVLRDSDDKVIGLDEAGEEKRAGKSLAQKIVSQVKNVIVIPMPEGHDVNSFYQAEGPDALRKRVGL